MKWLAEDMNLVSYYRKEGDSDGSMTGAHFVEHRIPNSMYIKHKPKQKIEGGISMYQTIRKTVSLLLAVVLILACGVMAVAAEREVEEPKAVCDHAWSITSSTPIKGRGMYVSNSGCRKYVGIRKVCPKCEEESFTKEYEEDPTAHKGYIKSATCDGTTQTHTYLCDYCNHNFTKTVRCPKAHPGISCPYLPI